MRKKIFITICVLILLGLITVGIIEYTNYNKKDVNNLLNGYYKLEKVISYYQVDEEKITEETNFCNNKKLYINNNKIESKIINLKGYYYIINDGKIYYSPKEINYKNMDNIASFDYEINNDYLIIIDRSEITESYYYKKISKEEY